MELDAAAGGKRIGDTDTMPRQQHRSAIVPVLLAHHDHIWIAVELDEIVDVVAGEPSQDETLGFQKDLYGQFRLRDAYLRWFVSVHTSTSAGASITCRLVPFPLGPGLPFRVHAIELA